MGAKKAEEIIKTGQFVAPDAWRGGQALLDLARLLATDPSAWYTAIEDADTEEIIAAIGGLNQRHDPWRYESFREAARAMVEQKIAERTIAEMRRLEKVGIALAVVGIFVAIPSAVIAAAQVLELFQ